MTAPEINYIKAPQKLEDAIIEGDITTVETYLPSLTGFELDTNGFPLLSLTVMSADTFDEEDIYGNGIIELDSKEHLQILEMLLNTGKFSVWDTGLNSLSEESEELMLTEGYTPDEKLDEDWGSDENQERITVIKYVTQESLELNDWSRLLLKYARKETAGFTESKFDSLYSDLEDILGSGADLLEELEELQLDPQLIDPIRLKETDSFSKYILSSYYEGFDMDESDLIDLLPIADPKRLMYNIFENEDFTSGEPYLDQGVIVERFLEDPKYKEHALPYIDKLCLAIVLDNNKAGDSDRDIDKLVPYIQDPDKLVADLLEYTEAYYIEHGRTKAGGSSSIDEEEAYDLAKVAVDNIESIITVRKVSDWILQEIELAEQYGKEEAKSLEKQEKQERRARKQERMEKEQEKQERIARFRAEQGKPVPSGSGKNLDVVGAAELGKEGAAIG